jgi:hypothetical protein
LNQTALAAVGPSAGSSSIAARMSAAKSGILSRHVAALMRLLVEEICVFAMRMAK